jgi:hypothetical protein
MQPTIEGYPLLDNGALNTVFSKGSILKLYEESLSEAREISSENGSWEFRSSKRIAVEIPESSFVGEFRRQFSSCAFSCEVLTS